MRLSSLLGPLLLSAGGASAFGDGPQQLVISGHLTSYVRSPAGEMGVIYDFVPTGSRIQAGRFLVSSATDENGTALDQADPKRFASVSVGKVDDSRDLTVREPISFQLRGLRRTSTEVRSLSGVLELLVPDLDPNATAALPDITAHEGEPLQAPALAAAGASISVTTKAGFSLDQAGPPNLPEAFSKMLPAQRLGPGDVAVTIDDPQDRVVEMEFRTAEGAPIRYNHAGNGHFSGWVSTHRVDTYHFESPLPAHAQLVVWLLTPPAVVKLPFHIEHLPIKGLSPGVPIGAVTIRLDQAAQSSADAHRYEQDHGQLQVRESDLQTDEAVLAAWDDAPAILDLYTHQPSIRQAPRLVASVPPEQVAGMPHPRITVHVSFLIDAQGNVAAARALEYTYPEYNRVAVEAVQRWKFQPARGEKGPITAFSLVPFVFEAVPRPGS